MSLISLIVVLVIVGVALYCIRLIPMDATVSKIITALVILAVVLWLLESVGLLTGVGHHVRFN